MAIKTYVSQGDKWNQIVGGSNVTNSANNIDFSMTTWDPCKINWSDYTTTPADVTWVGVNPNIYPAGGSNIIGCGQQNSFINGDMNWVNFMAVTQFTKPAGVRPDVLMGFFGPNLHALLFITDTLTYTMPFMERLGMIWIQHELNKWTAYDRKEFYAFIDNPDATTFSGVTLNKREVQKTMAEAKDDE